MNARELEDRVFELIEREATDPIGVLRTVASVPGGWGYFQRMKDAVELARHLPVQSPPPHLDARILDASSRVR
jgi:hypothetical protein